MKIDSVPLSSVNENAPKTGLFLQAMMGVVTVFKNVFLPHLSVGLGVFLLMTYATYLYLIVPMSMGEVWTLLCVLCCMVLYGSVALGLSLLMSCVFSLRKACVAWEEFLEEMLDQVKESALAKLDHFNDGIPKDQAKIVITGSVRETVQSFRPQSLSAVGNWLVAFVLGCLTLIMRSVLIAKVFKLSGKTVQMAKLFAGRATLVGAIFLNLRFFSTLLLILL